MFSARPGRWQLATFAGLERCRQRFRQRRGPAHGVSGGYGRLRTRNEAYRLFYQPRVPLLSWSLALICWSRASLRRVTYPNPHPSFLRISIVQSCGFVSRARCAKERLEDFSRQELNRPTLGLGPVSTYSANLCWPRASLSGNAVTSRVSSVLRGTPPARFQSAGEKQREANRLPNKLE